MLQESDTREGGIFARSGKVTQAFCAMLGLAGYALCLIPVQSANAATVYTITGEVESAFGDPFGRTVPDFIAGAHPVTISDSANFETSNESFGLYGAANVFAAGGYGGARLYTSSIYTRSTSVPGDATDYVRFSSTGTVIIDISDITISGVGSSTTTSLNLHLTGLMSATSSSSTAGNKFSESLLSATLFVNNSMVGDGVYTLTSANGGTATGSGTGWLTNIDGDDILTSGNVVVPVNTAFAVRIILSGGSRSFMENADTGTTSAELDFDNTLTFATDRPVFNLEDGFTANSASVGIINNQFVLVPEPGAGLLLAGSLLLGLSGWRRRFWFHYGEH